MKKILIIFLFLMPLFLCGCSKTDANDNSQYLRIHIRANSNSEVDQTVKYKVKDRVVDFLVPLISETKSKTELINIICSNMSQIERVADGVLRENGFFYKSHGSIREEYFPTRTYGELTLESDFYDALILELGSGTGDNWWCVVYPPLCFVNSKVLDSEGVVYKSKIWEIIKKFI